jgi:predicted alpha/beta-hydrolase family hydrolase
MASWRELEAAQPESAASARARPAARGMITRELATPEGVARAHLTAPAGSPRGALVLGHGAGGGVQAPDLQAAAAVAHERGWAVALVEQPYRVAGRRSPVPAPRLDIAWTSVCAQLSSGALDGLALVTGGRSSGARVACRTAAATGAAGVLCLAFPLQPPPSRRLRTAGESEQPPRRDGSAAPSRLPELELPDVPVLVVQGRNDRFGMVPGTAGRAVVVLEGDHGLKREHAQLRAAVAAWLEPLAGLGTGEGSSVSA